jgi:hypothetical protein
MTTATPVLPNTFEPSRHFYPRVQNASIHPVVRAFLGMGRDRLVQRYCHLNPRVEPETLTALLSRSPRWMRWSGCDLMHVTTADGRRRMVVIETNSSPSGQKSMPLRDEDQEQGGYHTLIDLTFRELIKARRPPPGALAVLYDKNPMEASGYAAAMADLAGKPVYLVPFYDGDDDAPARFVDGVLQIRTPDGSWTDVRAAFRYVTQRPWNRIPVTTRSVVLNPIIACLAGGRNKMVAAKAYELFNAELRGTGMQIHTPATAWDVGKAEIPLQIARLGGHGVVKVPYSNAGQGVYTITSQAELDAFMAEEHRYDRFIVQSLIGNYRWSSQDGADRYYHVGTLPDRKKRSFVADLRFMIGATPTGFRPLAVYARRARTPLVDDLASGGDSWSMLGTNLSVKRADGGWDTETERLMLMDNKDFNALGLSVDSLIEAFVQTVLSTLAIDGMAQNLMNAKGRFRRRLFASMNSDDALLEEILA